VLLSCRLRSNHDSCILSTSFWGCVYVISSEGVCLMKIFPTAGDFCCSAETLLQCVYVPFLLSWQAQLISWAQFQLTYALLSAFSSYQARTVQPEPGSSLVSSVFGSLCHLVFKHSKYLLEYRSFTAFGFASTKRFNTWCLH